MERNESGLILRKFNVKTALNDLQRIFCDEEFMVIKPANFPQKGIFDDNSLLKPFYCKANMIGQCDVDIVV